MLVKSLALTLKRAPLLSGLLIPGLLLVGSMASAQEEPPVNNRPYHFSGPCSSQGSWTQAALNDTQRLREVTLQLRDDASCKAFGNSMQATLSGLEKEFTSAADTEKRASTLATLPQEISAISSVMAEGSFMKHVLSPMLFGKLVTLSSQETQHQQAPSGGAVATAGTSQPSREMLLQSFQQRMMKSAQRGLTLFNNTIDQIPQLQTCLTDTNSMGQFFAGSINMLGSLISSGQDPIGTQTAQAISKLSSYMREKQFANVLQKLNQNDFMASISCMMEITSESYCSTRDARIMFNQMINQINPAKSSLPSNADDLKKRRLGGRDLEGPLAGYYILSQQVPVISNWLYKIQIGNAPRLEEDATFQTKILKNVNEFFIQMKTLEGYYYNQAMNLREMPDRKAKQNLMRQTILELGATMVKSDGSLNFFLLTYSSVEMPFRLIGIDTPAQVRGKSVETRMEGPEWINANYADLPEFQDPEALALRVEKNLRSILDSGMAAAIAYYNKNYIVDQAGIVNDSLLGMTYNVKDALVNIDRYLAGLKTRIEKEADDKTLVGSIVETRIKIGRVLARYHALREYSENLANKKFATADEEEEEVKNKLRVLNIALITEVYDQFQVLLARTGWLANRMTSFVWNDYQLIFKKQIRKDPNFFNPHLEELFYASGQMAFDRMLNIANGNPANINTDLNKALRINKENIAAMEMLFRDNVVQIVNDLKLASTRGQVNSKDITYNSIKRSYGDQWQKTPEDSRGGIQRFFSGLWMSTKTVFGFEEVRYPVHQRTFLGLKNKVIYSTDDEFQSSKNLLSQLCVQALAFQDLRGIWSNCQNIELASPFPKPQLNDSFAKTDRDYLSINFKNKAYANLKENQGLNQSNRICAFRDYNRRNMVAYLTLGMGNSKDNTQYKNEYTRVYDKPVPPTVPVVDSTDNQQRNELPNQSLSEEIPVSADSSTDSAE